jgi:hypothetical protein
VEKKPKKKREKKMRNGEIFQKLSTSLDINK